MDGKKYGIALIGCGSMGEAHLKDIYCKDNVQLVTVCDMQENRALQMQKKYGARRIETDYQKAVKATDVDIVIIATYPSSHLEILEECLQCGKHVLCEKPLADTRENGERMLELIRNASDSKVLIGYILRHNQTYQKVAEMVRGGAIGFPLCMRMTQNHHTMDWDKYLRLIEETSPIIDCGVHYLDVMRWFTGAEITGITGVGLRTEETIPKEKYNFGLITAKLSDGSVGYYEAGWGNTFSSSNIKEVVGPKGRISITLQMFRTENKEEGDLIEYYQYPEKTYTQINVLCKRKPTGAQLDALMKMVETGEEASPTLRDVQTSFEWALTADEYIRKKL